MRAHSGASASIPTEDHDAAVVELRAENARLMAALEPFAAYSRQMTAYGSLHRGQQLPDSKVLAYSQTEMNTCAALVVGHFRDAEAVFEGKPRGWDGFYRSTIRKPRAAPSDTQPQSPANQEQSK